MNAQWPPNPRFPLAGVMRTSGVPSNSFGADGWLATDPDTGEVYLKSLGAWLTLPVGPNEVAALIQTETISAADQFGTFAYDDLPGVSGAVVFNQVHCISGFDIENQTKITSMSWPKLVDIDPDNIQDGYFFLRYNTALVSVDVPLLETVGDYFLITSNSVASVNAPKLTTVGGGLAVYGIGPGDPNTALTSLSYPSAVNVGFLDAKRCSSLTTISLPNWIPAPGLGLNCQACALSVSTVNHLLARCVANAAFTTGSVSLDGGTNAAPSGQGIADAATLTGRGVSVTTN